MIELAIFGSTFIAVFALGFQSLNVNQGHYWAAAVTSAFISTGHIALYKFMPEASLPQLGAYYAGGILGITSSMWFHGRTLGKKRLAALEAQERRIVQAVLDRLQEDRIEAVVAAQQAIVKAHLGRRTDTH